MKTCTMARSALAASLLLAGVAGRAQADDAKLLKGYLKQVGSSDVELRQDAAFRLGEYPSPEAVEALGKALNDRDVTVRANAATALYNIGTPLAKAAEPALRNALKDSSGSVRIAAADALGRIGVPLGELRPVVSVVMASEDGRTRVEAAKVWLNMKGEPREAVAALAGAMHDPDDDVRKDAMDVFADLKPLPVEALAVVRDGTKDKHWSVRSDALRALSQLPPKQAAAQVPILAAALGDREEMVRSTALTALEETGTASPEVVEALVRGLKDKKPDVRRVAVDVIRRMEAKSALPALHELANTERDDGVKSSLELAFQALEKK